MGRRFQMARRRDRQGSPLQLQADRNLRVRRAGEEDIHDSRSHRHHQRRAAQQQPDAEVLPHQRRPGVLRGPRRREDRPLSGAAPQRPGGLPQARRDGNRPDGSAADLVERRRHGESARAAHGAVSRDRVTARQHAAPSGHGAQPEVRGSDHQANRGLGDEANGQLRARVQIHPGARRREVSAGAARRAAAHAADPVDEGGAGGAGGAGPRGQGAGTTHGAADGYAWDAPRNASWDAPRNASHAGARPRAHAGARPDLPGGPIAAVPDAACSTSPATTPRTSSW